LILSHHKNLKRGDHLIDDRPWHNGFAPKSTSVLSMSM
jgi:hypothetical protein